MVRKNFKILKIINGKIIDNLPDMGKISVICNTIDSLRVKDKRLIFHTLRKTPNATKDYFFPTFGFTTSEFACWQILSDSRKNRSSKK